MAFHCANCNGSMVFDVTSQQMRCLHCGSTCDPDDFIVRDEGIATDDQGVEAGMARFTCPSCGAALEGTDDSLVGFCPYCGGQDMVASAADGPRPERLIPFQVDKAGCTEAWSTFAHKVPYLPAELKDPTYVERFTGIYMPFWQFDVQFGTTRMTGSKRRLAGNTETITYANIDVTPKDTYQGICYDASTYLSDDLAERSQPFDQNKERAFSPAYLAGFYADASTVDAERYHQAVENLAAEDLLLAATKKVRNHNSYDLDNDPSNIDSRVTADHQVLWPMWFLTWRKDDRVAYAVVNGESGKVVSDLPLDLKQFAIGCAIASVAAFALLELLVQPTPMVTVLVGMAASLLMAFGLKRAAQQEWEHHMHLEEGDDTGGLKRRQGHQRLRLGGGAIAFIIILAVFFLQALMSTSLSFSSSILVSLIRMLLSAATICYVTYVGIKIFGWNRRAKNHPAVISYLVLLASAVACAAVAWWDPVNDGWFYLADAACIIGLMGAAALMIRTYNVSTMRPAPRLFDREEVQ